MLHDMSERGGFLDKNSGIRNYASKLSNLF